MFNVIFNNFSINTVNKLAVKQIYKHYIFD